MLQPGHGEGYVPGAAGERYSYVDEGDHYYLNTGEKVSYLRRERTFLIINDRRRTPIPGLSEAVGFQAGGDVEIVREHGPATFGSGCRRT